MKHDDIKDMANTMNSEETKQAERAWWKLAIYTIPLWLPFVLWGKYQDYKAEKQNEYVAVAIKTDFKYPAEFYTPYIRDPESYKQKMDKYLAAPKKNKHPFETVINNQKDDVDFYEKAFMDLNRDGVITKGEAEKWKEDVNYQDGHHAQMNNNYKRYGHIDGYKELVQYMPTETAQRVGWYATHYPVNYDYLKDFYQGDIESFRKLMMHGLSVVDGNAKNGHGAWSIQFALLRPVNDKQAALTEKNLKENSTFAAMIKNEPAFMFGK